MRPYACQNALIGCCLGLAGGLLGLDGAQADPVAARKSAEAARCAAQGEGFSPVAGGQTCVKISGRVRVEYMWSKSGPTYRGGSGHSAVGAGTNRAGGAVSGLSAFAPIPPPPSRRGEPRAVFGQALEPTQDSHLRTGSFRPGSDPKFGF